MILKWWSYSLYYDGIFDDGWWWWRNCESDDNNHNIVGTNNLICESLMTTTVIRWMIIGGILLHFPFWRDSFFGYKTTDLPNCEMLAAKAIFGIWESQGQTRVNLVLLITKSRLGNLTKTHRQNNLYINIDAHEILQINFEWQKCTNKFEYKYSCYKWIVALCAST